MEQTAGVGDLEEPVLVGVADDEIDAESSTHLRGELGVAPGGDDRGVGVAPSELADELAALLGGDRCHGAGVEDAELGGLARTDDPVPGGRQRSRQRLDFADVEAAPNRFRV